MSSIFFDGNESGAYCSSSTSRSASTISSIANDGSPPSVKSTTHEEQNKCAGDLDKQSYYWGSASKETISTALENQRDGTFVVRDASTPGQFTLTLRIDGANKLIKILVGNEKCGFTPDSLDFDSVPALIQFYRTCSLRDFNERLDTCLINPLTSPDYAAKQQNETRSSASKKRDLTYHTNILKCRLEGLHADYDRVSRRYDQLFGQKSALSDEYVRKQQTFTAYAEAMRIFERKIAELRKALEEETGLGERDVEAIQMNIELQEERLEEIGKAQTLVQTALLNIGRTLANIDEELEELKPMLLKLHKKQDKCRDKLLALPRQQHTTHAQLDRLVQAVSLALDSETATLSTFLLRAPMPLPEWDCENWLWHQGTKEQAAALIRSLLPKCGQKDGLFLIRPSASRPGFYALEISKNGNVHSCLIEFRDTRSAIDHCGGYGFANTQMLFASLKDFVRYYANVSLKEHNTMLDTLLTVPVLGLERRNRKRQNKRGEKVIKGVRAEGEAAREENE